MIRVVEPPAVTPEDTARFLGFLDAIATDPSEEVRRFFEPGADVFVARAPGRLDVMGGIADYSGSLVLQLPIGRATHAAVQRATDGSFTIVSGDPTTRSWRTYRVAVDRLAKLVAEGDYAAARAYFLGDPESAWAAYVAGVPVALMRERGVSFDGGARVLVTSDVPEGKGVSSSAALEVATMTAIGAAFGVDGGARDVALLSQLVENRVVGAPCGVMDQMASSCGEQGRLLALLCQPAELQGLVPLPADAAVWGLDSGVRHAVVGEDYGSVRTGAFMGYRIIADAAGLRAEVGSDGVARVDDPVWHGYLANVLPEEFTSRFVERLPERMGGAEFLATYGGTTDQVTRVQPESVYPVRAATTHPVMESARVQRFRQILSDGSGPSRLAELGELMYESHASYSACGLGEERTDLLVDLVRSAGHEAGLFGAKITGGGSGGTVAVLGRADAAAAVERVVDEYERRTGYRPVVFAESSPGAGAFGHARLAIG